jgi:hypothetical protein
LIDEFLPAVEGMPPLLLDEVVVIGQFVHRTSNEID